MYSLLRVSLYRHAYLFIHLRLYTFTIITLNNNLQIDCKFTNDKGTLHWSHIEPLMLVSS